VLQIASVVVVSFIHTRGGNEQPLIWIFFSSVVQTFVVAVDGADVVVTGSVVGVVVGAGRQLFFASSPTRSTLPAAAEEAD